MSDSSLTIVVNKNTPLVVEAFSGIGNVIALDTTEVTRERVRDADILIVRSETRVDHNLLDGSKVRFVGTVTIGTDHVDLEYLAARGIRFANAPGSNANSVAEYIVAALLTWSERKGEGLRGKTIGVVGVGNVGRKVVRAARILGMNVLCNDPPLARLTGDPAFLSLDGLMEADIITLHVPLSRSGPDPTYHLFDERRINRMKRGSVLINTSRGGVVATDALHAALSSGRISTAILDVWEGEPEIDIGLLSRVAIGTAHIAGYSLDGKLNALRMVYEEVCRYLAIPPRWDGSFGDTPEPHPAITVPEHVTDPENVLRSAVSRTYDIELDDYLLRRIALVPQDERAQYFMRLRADYRIRREFFHRVVELGRHHTAAKQLLEGMGFLVRLHAEKVEEPG